MASELFMNIGTIVAQKHRSIQWSPSCNGIATVATGESLARTLHGHSKIKLVEILEAKSLL